MNPAVIGLLSLLLPLGLLSPFILSSLLRRVRVRRRVTQRWDARTSAPGCELGTPASPPTGGGPTSFSADPARRDAVDPECPALCDSGEEPGPGFQPDRSHAYRAVNQ